MSKSQLLGADKAISNTKKLLKSLNADEFREAMIPAGRVFLEGAKSRAPYDPKREKGTHLRDALFIDARPHGHTDILVGVNNKKAPHAHLQEFGWSKNPSGHPFMRPTAVEDEPQIKQAIADGVKSVIEKRK